MNTIVEAECLTKRFGDLIALDAVSFALEAGKIYGLMGRNGSGKTTLMRLLTAQMFATSGTVRVCGEPPFENSHVLSQICFIKDDQKYPNGYRVIDVLEQAALFCAYWDRDYAFALAEDFQLPLKRRMKALSRGMRSAAGIIVGLASRAPLTIFDEPNLGLDPVARGLFYERLLAAYAEQPRTIILSTHLIDEVSRLLEHVLVLDRGRLILDADAEALRGRVFAVIGPATKIDIYTAGKDVLDRVPFGSLVSATVMGHGDMTDRTSAEALGLDLAPVSLQQLIVHLTSDPSARKEVAAR